jgi:hypothetical protein
MQFKQILYMELWLFYLNKCYLCNYGYSIYFILDRQFNFYPEFHILDSGRTVCSLPMYWTSCTKLFPIASSVVNFPILKMKCSMYST